MTEFQVCSKEGSSLFSKGDNYKIAKVLWQSLKSPESHWANNNQFNDQ